MSFNFPTRYHSIVYNCKICGKLGTAKADTDCEPAQIDTFAKCLCCDSCFDAREKRVKAEKKIFSAAHFLIHIEQSKNPAKVREKCHEMLTMATRQYAGAVCDGLKLETVWNVDFVQQIEDRPDCTARILGAYRRGVEGNPDMRPKTDPQFLAEARALGGLRLFRICEYILDSQYAIPLTPNQALKFRGTGKKSIGQLIRLGIVQSWKRPGELHALHHRIYWRLESAGIRTRKELLEGVKSGRVAPHQLKEEGKEWQYIRGYGWKSHIEVCRFLGLPDPKPKRAVVLCPHCGKNTKEAAL